MRTILFVVVVAMLNGLTQAQTLEPKLVTVGELKAILAQDHGAVLVQFTSTDKACSPCIDSNTGIPEIAGSEHWIHPFLRVSWTPWTATPAGLPIADRMAALPMLVVFLDGKDVKDYVGYSAAKADEITRLLQPYNNGRPAAARHPRPLAIGPPAASLKFAQQKISLLWGQTYAASIDARDSQGKAMSPLPALSWSSGAENIAVVDETGRIHTLRRGHTTITARSGSAAAAIDVEVTGFSDIATTSIDTTCALTDSRLDIYCWGNAANNRIFAKHAANSFSYESPVQIQSGEIPAGTRIASLVTSTWSTCALSEAGRVYCWGEPHNQLSLGTGDIAPRAIPTAIEAGEIPPGVKITSLAASATAICATATDAQFYCWGATNSMPIGPNLPHTPTLMKPTRMELGEIPPGASLSAIGMGINGGCVIASGDAYCWSSHSIPRLVGPGDLASNVKLTAISVTDDITCALGDDNRAYCFGKAVGRRFGGGIAAFVSTPAWKLVAMGDIPAASKLKQLSVGGIANVSCVIADDHKAYCWGKNTRGSIGTGDEKDADILKPKRVSDGQVPNDVALLKVTCAQAHCAVLANDGRIYTWGSAQNAAELGRPVNTHIAGPQLINAPLP